MNQEQSFEKKNKEEFCLWHDKKLRDVFEHESEACAQAGLKCQFCDFLKTR